MFKKLADMFKKLADMFKKLVDMFKKLADTFKKLPDKKKFKNGGQRKCINLSDPVPNCTLTLILPLPQLHPNLNCTLALIST